jgi:hypothetical protein
MGFFLAMFALFIHPCTSANHHFLLTTAPNHTTSRHTTNHTGTNNILTSRSQHCNPESTLPTKNQLQPYRPHTHPPQSQRRRPARHTPRPLLSHLRHGASKSRKQYHASTVHPQLPTYLPSHNSLRLASLYQTRPSPRPENGKRDREPGTTSTTYPVSLVLLLYRRASFVPSSTPLSRTHAHSSRCRHKSKSKKKKAQRDKKNNHWRCCCWYTLDYLPKVWV